MFSIPLRPFRGLSLYCFPFYTTNNLGANNKSVLSSRTPSYIFFLRHLLLLISNSSNLQSKAAHGCEAGHTVASVNGVGRVGDVVETHKQCEIAHYVEIKSKV